MKPWLLAMWPFSVLSTQTCPLKLYIHHHAYLVRHVRWKFNYNHHADLLRHVRWNFIYTTMQIWWNMSTDALYTPPYRSSQTTCPLKLYIHHHVDLVRLTMPRWSKEFSTERKTGLNRRTDRAPQTSKMERLATMVNSFYPPNYCCEAFHLRL